MLRTLFWRSLLIGLGLLWLGCAAADVHRIVTEGGWLAWTLGALHGAVFLVLGAGTCLLAWLVDGAYAREIMAEFLRDVFSRKNLIECGSIIAGAILVAAVLAVMSR